MERIGTTIASTELGMSPGSLDDLDAIARAIGREELASRCISVLTGLDADRKSSFRNVSLSLANALGDAGAAVRAALTKQDSIYVEPMQQLVLLRRALTVGGDGTPAITPDETLRLYADGCRISADLLREQDKGERIADGGVVVDQALRIAAVFLVRLSLLNPPHPTQWLARLRIMFRDLPKADARAEQWAQRLRERFVEVFGLPFEDVGRLAQILTLWAMRFRTLEDVIKNFGDIPMNVDTFLSKTTLNKHELMKFFDRTARPVEDELSDQSSGGALSILPFRDRPFLRLSDQRVAPIYPGLVAEKMTYDFFWWTVDPAKKQDQPWQREWGDLVELYVVRLLADIAVATGCEFSADIKFDGGQIDAAMWRKGHVAVFEISAGMMTDAAGHNGDWQELRSGLTRVLVRSISKGKPKDEAIAQVARDARLLLAGQLKHVIPVDVITRVYPVVIAIDRRIQSPPLRFWFDDIFTTETVSISEKSRLAPLAVLGLEDLEIAEQLIRENHPALTGTPPGLLRLLRRWEIQRERLTTKKRAGSWGHFVAADIGEPGPNERLKAESDTWWNEVKDLFHDEPE